MLMMSSPLFGRNPGKYCSNNFFGEPVVEREMAEECAIVRGCAEEVEDKFDVGIWPDFPTVDATSQGTCGSLSPRMEELREELLTKSGIVIEIRDQCREYFAEIAVVEALRQGVDALDEVAVSATGVGRRR
ncbi:hypothetical protein K8P10_002991 [Leucobacter sp. Psy1]|nr:hypothetical protein K8P10_002991 [Leucobacter sp. Psy1]